MATLTGQMASVGTAFGSVNNAHSRRMLLRKAFPFLVYLKLNTVVRIYNSDHWKISPLSKSPASSSLLLLTTRAMAEQSFLPGSCPFPYVLYQALRDFRGLLKWNRKWKWLSCVTGCTGGWDIASPYSSSYSKQSLSPLDYTHAIILGKFPQEGELIYFKVLDSPRNWRI